MAEHKHGSMDSTANEKTYNSFITFVTRSVIVIIGILLFMALFAR